MSYVRKYKNAGEQRYVHVNVIVHASWQSSSLGVLPNAALFCSRLSPAYNMSTSTRSAPSNINNCSPHNPASFFYGSVPTFDAQFLIPELPRSLLMLYSTWKGGGERERPTAHRVAQGLQDEYINGARLVLLCLRCCSPTLSISTHPL